MLGINKENIDLQDILYGGFAGEMPLPDIFNDTQDLHVSDPKQGQIPETVTNSNPDTYTYNEAVAAALLVSPVGRDDASRRCGMRLWAQYTHVNA